MTLRSQHLGDLLEGIAPAVALAPLRNIVVRGLTLDSRHVRNGDAFVALRGGTTHGIAFAPAAIAQGAAVILGEAPPPAAIRAATITGRDEPVLPGNREGGLEVPDAHAPHAWSNPSTATQPGSGRTPPPNNDLESVPVIWIERLRERLGGIAARFFGHPSAALHVIGVTGTNGKTSIVQLAAAALRDLGARAATLGTLGAGFAGAVRAGERTTPDAISVQALLAEFRDAGASHVAMEVSSHALQQGRVNAVDFEVAAFTNLTRDHLDYHGTMENYGAAKARLFGWPGLRAAVINVDDAFGAQLAAALPAGVQGLRYGIENDSADIVARNVRSGTDGLRFMLKTPWGTDEVATSLLGHFNVANLLAVAGCLGALGCSFAQIRTALAQAQAVAGRMNRLGGGELPLIVVDYAHTPDALAQALASLRAHTHGSLICVFGCGGERDQGKRPQMAAIAEGGADQVIVTDDNPRGENGDAIVAQIVAGFARPQAVEVERDRALAIASALRRARRGDVVLIAGKGHESYQEIAGIKHPFDDIDVARRALQAAA